MRRFSLRRGLAAPVLTILVSLVLAEYVLGGDFGREVGVAFLPRRLMNTMERDLSVLDSMHVRGGASRAMDEEEEEYSDDEDILDEVINELEDESDEEEELDTKLTASAMKSSSKTKAKIQAQKAAKIKKAVNTKLNAKKSKTAAKKNKSSGGLFKIPYIMRALINPFTAFAMTRAFWISLFSLDYPPKDSSQDLRSSIEEKNRNTPSTFQKPKRKMKRGQAKTLSDLPQLNT